MAVLNVELVAADRKVWSGEASSVIAPSTEGEIGILPGHEPLLAVLREGQVRVTPVTGEKFEGTVDGGFLSVDSNRVTIVADSVTVATGDSTS
ncbi:F0F1 ATP synthase subunit epsilon [Pengzhenrongella sp.]|jgi:F-type H+-transporting ATPase subunit epsilon|uniref:F0F1 ATP synthase subunit epsilon n=1 Tax=Pengzhenrongella sp. TaxID=2888820 RepID=UPI002F95B83C